MDQLSVFLIALLLQAQTMQVNDDPDFPVRILDGQTYIEVQKNDKDTYSCWVVTSEWANEHLRERSEMAELTMLTLTPSK